MMYSYYLYFPVGSNQDGFGHSGLVHLVEHYLILALKEKCTKDNTVIMHGQTGHEHILFSWMEHFYYKFNNTTVQNILSLIEDIRNNDILVDENLLWRAKEEVAYEVSTREDSIDRYNQLLYFIAEEGVVSPIGELENINNITKIDIYKMLNQFRFARLYIYDWNSDYIQSLNLNQIDKTYRVRQYRHVLHNFVSLENVKLNIGKYRIKILIPAKRTIPSDDRDMFKNGAIRDFLIQLLYDKIFLYIDNIKEINHSKFMISKERVYYQFDIQTTYGIKSDVDINKEYRIAYFINQEEFLNKKNDLIYKLKLAKEILLTEKDIYNEIMNMEFLNERTLLNNKKDALDIIDCISFKDMEDFINVQLVGDKIWIFEG